MASTSRFTPSKSAAPQYSFPLLSAEEIVQCLAELNIPLSEEQLRKPTPEAVRAVFEHFLEMLMGVSREELNQPAFGAADVLSYPELHDESVGVIGFHRAMQRLLDACGVQDFTLADYMSPQFPRLRRLLSAVINLAKFREERLVRFQQLSEHAESLLVRRQQLHARRGDTRGELEALRAQREREQPQAERIDGENRPLAAELHALHRRQNSLQADIRSLKSQCAALGESAAEQRVSLLNERHELAALQAQVVRSPARVRGELDAEFEQLELERERLASMERRTRELQSRASGLERCEADVRRVVLLMEECERDMRASREQQRVVRERRQAIAAAEGELRRLKQQDTYLRRQAASAEERRDRVRRQMDERAADTQARREQQHSEREAALREKAAVDERVRQNDALVAQAREKADALKAELEEEMVALKDAYAALEHNVVEYHRELFAAMQSVTVANAARLQQQRPLKSCISSTG